MGDQGASGRRAVHGLSSAPRRATRIGMYFVRGASRKVYLGSITEHSPASPPIRAQPCPFSAPRVTDRDLQLQRISVMLPNLHSEVAFDAYDHRAEPFGQPRRASGLTLTLPR